MAAWNSRGSLEPFRDRLIDGMARNGYDREFAETCTGNCRVWEYGFPKAIRPVAKLAWLAPA